MRYVNYNHTRREMDTDTTRRGVVSFPREIGRFFTGGTGQTLLVDGAPGTGKTLFTLRALDVLARDGDVLYVSTRVDSETVAETYLGQTTVSEGEVLDLSQDPFDLPMDVDVPFEQLGLDSLSEWLRETAAASARTGWRRTATSRQSGRGSGSGATGSDGRETRLRRQELPEIRLRDDSLDVVRDDRNVADVVVVHHRRDLVDIVVGRDRHHVASHVVVDGGRVEVGVVRDRPQEISRGEHTLREAVVRDDDQRVDLFGVHRSDGLRERFVGLDGQHGSGLELRDWVRHTFVRGRLQLERRGTGTQRGRQGGKLLV